ncbi:MAG: HEAT repeat domain-containing protein, partial [Halobacteriaceae archaeon]
EPAGSPEEVADDLDDITSRVADANLDPDEDAEKLQALLDAAEAFADAIEEAEEWDDLTVREQLQARGFYETLGEKHKDFPPEWTALKGWEKENDAEMVLLALEKMDSDFMERHAIEALERMGDEAAIETMLQRAERRDKPAIRVLGRIAVPNEDVVETLEEFAAEESDPGLQKVTLKALGRMGATDALQTIADQLAVENESVRSHAARTLGLVGDTRAVDPLKNVLSDDESDTVRASAAWALTQIGTREALEAAADHADDQSYLVQSEAETAAEALKAETAA